MTPDAGTPTMIVIAIVLAFIGLCFKTRDHEEGNKYLGAIGQPKVSDGTHVGEVVVVAIIVGAIFAFVYFGK